MDQNIRYHCPVYCVLKFDKLITPIYTRHIWLYDRGDYESFSRDLNDMDWSSIKNNDIDEYENNITECESANDCMTNTKFQKILLILRFIKIFEIKLRWKFENQKKKKKKKKKNQLDKLSELENVFAKHYAPNHMPDPKGEWSLKENNSELHYGICSKVYQFIYTLVCNYMPVMRTLAKAVLQISRSKGCSYTKCLCPKKKSNATGNLRNGFKS